MIESARGAHRSEPDNTLPPSARALAMGLDNRKPFHAQETPGERPRAASGPVRRPEAPSPFLGAPTKTIRRERIRREPPIKPNRARRGGTSADLYMRYPSSRPLP